MKRVESVFDSMLFRSRWLLAPFFIGLILAIVALLLKFAKGLAQLAVEIVRTDGSELIVSILTGNLPDDRCGVPSKTRGAARAGGPLSGSPRRRPAAASALRPIPPTATLEHPSPGRCAEPEHGGPFGELHRRTHSSQVVNRRLRAA